MTAWHRSTKANLLLRALGLILGGISYAAVSRVYDLCAATPDGYLDQICFRLAAVSFVAASAGAALMCLGNHLFDEVELPARYRRGSQLSSTNERL